MNQEVSDMLERSPSPLKWTILTLLFAGLAIWFRSAIFAAVWGVLSGWYFGNYRGRSAIIDAWQRDLEIEHQRLRRLRVKLDEEGK